MLEAHEEEMSEEDLRERLEQYQKSNEFQQHLENSLYGVTLAVSPLFGLFYGVLAGGILGALCPISPVLHVTAGRGPCNWILRRSKHARPLRLGG